MVTRDTHARHPADTMKETNRYLVIVAASEPAVFQYLTQCFVGDHRTDVIVDRRRRPRDDRRLLSFNPVVVARSGATVLPQLPITARGAERTLMEDTHVVDDRQRVDRWLEESQYLMGRLIPGFLDDRDRLRAKLEQAEQEDSRLRTEILELRKEIQGLHGDVQFYKSEQAAAVETMSGVMEALSQLQRPVSDLSRRLQTAHPIGAS
jgi:hypothetical protein